MYLVVCFDGRIGQNKKGERGIEPQQGSIPWQPCLPMLLDECMALEGVGHFCAKGGIRALGQKAVTLGGRLVMTGSAILVGIAGSADCVCTRARSCLLLF
jgi:hypothetical protein